MDWHKLQQTLFEIDPSDPKEDLRKRAESAGQNVESAPTVDYVQESVEVAEGSLGLDKDYSVADFAALAGIVTEGKQKTGSAGQLKGKDAIKKNPAGTTKNPTRDKLVGEDFKSDYEFGKANYNKLKVFSPGDKDDKSSSKTSTKPSTKPSTKSKADPINSTSNSWRDFLKKHTVALQQIAADPKKTQRFETWLEKWNESIEEAPKQKPIKARDPNSQYMNDLRKSGAMGAHKDKKRDAKMGKEKHKKDYTTESIKQMLYRKLNESK